MKAAHRVPLSDRCIAILESAASIRAGDLVFPSSTNRQISDSTISKLLREQGIPAVPHGFRSTFRDWASEMTDTPKAVMEAALAHSNKDKVEAAYARSDLFDRRRVLMGQWADYLAK